MSGWFCWWWVGSPLRGWRPPNPLPLRPGAGVSKGPHHILRTLRAVPQRCPPSMWNSTRVKWRSAPLTSGAKQRAIAARLCPRCFPFASKQMTLSPVWAPVQARAAHDGRGAAVAYQPASQCGEGGGGPTPTQQHAGEADGDRRAGPSRGRDAGERTQPSRGAPEEDRGGAERGDS